MLKTGSCRRKVNQLLAILAANNSKYHGRVKGISSPKPIHYMLNTIAWTDIKFLSVVEYPRPIIVKSRMGLSDGHGSHLDIVFIEQLHKNGTVHLGIDGP